MGLFNNNDNEYGQPVYGGDSIPQPEQEPEQVSETMPEQVPVQEPVAEQEPEPEQVQEPVVKPKPVRKNRTGSKITRTQATKIIETYQQIQNTNDTTRVLLAALLGVKPDPVTVAAEAATGVKTANNTLQQLTDLVLMEETDTALTLLGGGRKEMRPIWGIAQALHGTEEQIPGQDIPAARRLAHLLHTLPDQATSALDQVAGIIE